MVDITWKKYEKDIHSQDVDTAIKATEAFVEERNRQMATSDKARKWEEDRRKTNAKEKIQWKKEQLKKDEVKDFKEGLRSWSGYDSMIQPCANYLIVETKKQTSTTETGIVLQTESIRDNVGVCIAIGGDYIGAGYRLPLPPPCKVGDKIMFKLGAGIEVEIKDKKYKFMTYADVLGIFND